MGQHSIDGEEIQRVFQNEHVITITEQIYVPDGDGLHVNPLPGTEVFSNESGRMYSKLRLAGCDAPERGQDKTVTALLFALLCQY